MTQTPIAHFFQHQDAAKMLFDGIAIRLLERFPESSFKIQKSQIALVSTKTYAALWLPIHPIKDHPEAKLILSFGLDEKLEDPRIREVNEPYPKRYMHHILLSQAEDLDETLLTWLEKAIVFSDRKGRHNP